MYATLQTWKLIIYSGKLIKSFGPSFTGNAKIQLAIQTIIQNENISVARYI